MFLAQALTAQLAQVSTKRVHFLVFWLVIDLTEPHDDLKRILIDQAYSPNLMTSFFQILLGYADYIDPIKYN
jgi:hypothetical protein